MSLGQGEADLHIFKRYRLPSSSQTFSPLPGREPAGVSSCRATASRGTPPGPPRPHFPPPSPLPYGRAMTTLCSSVLKFALRGQPKVSTSPQGPAQCSPRDCRVSWMGLLRHTGGPRVLLVKIPLQVSRPLSVGGEYGTGSQDGAGGSPWTCARGV